MERLGFSHPYLLAYQSEVGPLRWLGPSTEQVIRNLGARGHKRVLVVPIAFTSDHIETLSELDREYGEVAHQAGITHYRRAPALNERPLFLDALADIVREHLAAGEVSSTQYPMRCRGLHQPAVPEGAEPRGPDHPARAGREVEACRGLTTARRALRGVRLPPEPCG